jgi:hypothetical protein
MKSGSSKSKPGRPRAGPPQDARALGKLYEADETAWLEKTSDLIERGDYDRLDYQHLREYLSDMARRDRREVLHRLTTLLLHLLKWDHQPALRSRSWKVTIKNQRDELQDLLESQTLKNHAGAVLSKAYARARSQASGETGLDEAQFPETCPYSLDQVVGSG